MICARFLGCLEHFRVSSVAFPKTFGAVRFGLIPTFAVQLAGSDSFPGHSQVCFEKRLADFSWTDHIIARLAALPGMPYWSNWLWESMTWMRRGDKHDQSRTFSSPRLLEWPSGTCDMLANQKCNDFALSFSLFITVKVCSWTYCQKSKIFKQDAKCKKLVSYEAGSQKPSTNNWRLDWTLRCFLGNSSNCFVGQDQKWHSHVSHTCWALSVAASIWPRRRTMKKIFRRL